MPGMKTPQKEVNKLKSLLEVELHDNISKLCSIWTEIGVVESQIRERSQKVAYHVNELLKRMVMEEEKLKSRHAESTNRYILMASEISKKLQLPFEQPEAHLSILEKEKEMKSLVGKLQEARDKRIDEWQTLTQSHRDCSILMMMKPMDFDASSEIPTLCDIGHLKIQVYDVEKELDVRKRQMSDYKRTIKTLVGELDYKLDLGERPLLSDDPGELLFSESNMDLHRNFVEKLDKIKCQSLSEILSYKEELKKSFEFKLDGEATFDEKEFSQFCQASLNLAAALRERVQLKRQKIKSVVHAKQKELHNLWDLCQVTCEHIEDRKNLLNADVENVDGCRLKEEVSEMEQYYENNKDILNMHKQYRELFADLCEAERKCTQTSKYSKVAGSSRDEKVRHKMSKEVLKFQEKLAKEVSEWEERKATNCLFKGMKIKEYIEHAHAQLKSDKEVWKAEVRGKQSDALPPVPTITPFKRKIANITPSKIAAKILKLDANTPVCFRQNVIRTPLSSRKLNENQAECLTRSHKKELQRQNSGKSPKHALRRSGSDQLRVSGSLRRSGQLPSLPTGRGSRGNLHSNSNPSEKNSKEIMGTGDKKEKFIDETASYEDFSQYLARSDKSFISSSVIVLPKKDPLSQKFFEPIKF